MTARHQSYQTSDQNGNHNIDFEGGQKFDLDAGQVPARAAGQCLLGARLPSLDGLLHQVNLKTQNVDGVDHPPCHLS